MEKHPDLREYVVPYTGELVDLSDPVACGEAVGQLRELEVRIAEAKRVLADAIAERAQVLGQKTITLPDGRKLEVRGGKSKVYDVEAIESELREAGMPEERIREIIREEVSYTLRVAEAKRAAAANEEYARILERHTRTVETPYYVTIKR
ncbi:MAG: hypothetical protein KatS3mg015_2469 [Fimbriimonadales bacterium]|nr:MAG: hypothetical protein KatS3mg015_2469 [Fimbriimonadales bacterium]